LYGAILKNLFILHCPKKTCTSIFNPLNPAHSSWPLSGADSRYRSQHKGKDITIKRAISGPGYYHLRQASPLRKKNVNPMLQVKRTYKLVFAGTLMEMVFIVMETWCGTIRSKMPRFYCKKNYKGYILKK